MTRSTVSILVPVILLAIASAHRLAAGTLVLARDGAAKAVVLIPSKPTKMQTYAANYMARNLSAMTGGKFKVVAESPGKVTLSQPVISIGRTSLAEGVAIQGPEWVRKNPEAFRVVHREDALIICGNHKGQYSDWGTLWGVYWFLEHQGLGYFYPCPLGDVIPKKPTLAVNTMDFSDAPWMGMRGGGNPASQLRRYEPGGDLANKWPPEGRDYELKSGISGGIRNVEFFHMYQYVITADVRKAHPEWFATAPGPHGICLTNPGIRQVFIEYLSKRLKEHPDLDEISICPDDYALGDRCSCAECQELMALSGPATWTDDGKRSASDLHIHFANALARGLEKKFPNKKLITYAYLDYLDPPRKIRVHPNVVIMVAPLRSPDEVHPALDNIVNGWREMGARKLYWYGYILSRPPVPNLMGQWFRKYKRLRIDGVYLEFAPGTLAYTGLASWLAGKLMWNPDADVPALVDQYCKRLYGPKAGPLMSRAFHAWETKPPFYAEDLPMLLSAAQKAAGAPSSDYGKRVRLVKLAFDLWKTGVDLDEALKLNDIAEASEIVKSGIADADAIRSEYPKHLFLNMSVALYNRVGWGEYNACVKDSLSNLLTTPINRPPREPALPGPTKCLTSNSDIPQTQRLDAGVQVRFFPSDGEEFSASRLFDGAVSPASRSVYSSGFANLTIDLDLQRPYQIDHLDICTGTNVGASCLLPMRSVPIYVEIRTSDNGTDFDAVDRIIPRTLPGYISSRELLLSARYVRLIVYGLNFAHDVGEVRVWGREKP